jgi:hypothetical protein
LLTSLVALRTSFEKLYKPPVHTVVPHDSILVQARKRIGDRSSLLRSKHTILEELSAQQEQAVGKAVTQQVVQ